MVEVADGPDGPVVHGDTYALSYVQGGNLVLQLEDRGIGADGTIDFRSIFTSEYDERGSLLLELREFDSGADGTVEARITASYDHSGSARR